MVDTENIAEGTISTEEIQQQKKVTKVIWRMVSLAFYSLGASFVAVFLTSQLKLYLTEELLIPDVDAQGLFLLTAAVGTTVYIIAAVIGGSISDGLRTRFGNRLPIVILGAAMASIMYIIAPYFITKGG